ncbi:MAG: VWA domain-containing protein [Treponema sp.]|jgi:hypothetical protein|nr:VWA domain-containing protein [Treponema sp.]
MGTKVKLKGFMLALLGVGIFCSLQGQEKILRIGFTEQAGSFQDMPLLHISLVVDGSRSMAWDNKMTGLKKALARFVSKLRDIDSVELISFNVAGDVRFSFTRMDSLEKRRRFLDALETLSPQGGTRLEAGFSMGYEQAMAHYQDDAVNMVIFFTDEVDFSSFDFTNTLPPASVQYQLLETYTIQGVSAAAVRIDQASSRLSLPEETQTPVDTQPVFHVMGQDNTGTPRQVSGMTLHAVPGDKEFERFRMISQPEPEISRISRGTGGISRMSQSKVKD